MTSTTLNQPGSFRQRVIQWFDNLPPILRLPADVGVVVVEDDQPPAQDVILLLHPGPVFFWLLSKLPVWTEITREEAVQSILQCEVRVRYQPLIVEMDRKTILNEVR
jgi:hypothetical protein